MITTNTIIALGVGYFIGRLHPLIIKFIKFLDKEKEKKNE